MLRIMQVAYSFAIGGSEIVVRDIALGLVKAGWPSGVCALEHDGPLNAEMTEAGVWTKVIAKRGRERFGPTFRLWRAFRAFRPDVVHTHHVYELIYSWPGAILCGATLVHTEHEFHSLAGDRRRISLRILAKLCRKVTAVNEETADYLRDVIKIPRNKVVTVANGVDLSLFSCHQKETTRKRLGLSITAPVAGIVARLEPPKNHTLLLKAFSTVVSQRQEAQLLVIGDGSLRDTLEDLSQELKLTEHVTFLGARRDIPELLAALDLFVLSSDREGLPVALIEAMAAKLPVVTTAAGGIASLLEDSVSGYLVRSNDAEQLSACILSMFSDPNKGRQFGENGRSFVAKNFSMETVLKHYLEIYSNAIQ